MKSLNFLFRKLRSFVVSHYSFNLILVCGLGFFQACSSTPELSKDFFPLDGQWTLTKVSCPQSPIAPITVEQINTRINQRKLYYVLSVKGKDVLIRQRIFPDIQEEGFCESEIKLKLRELPAHALKIESVEVVYEKSHDISDKAKCPKRSDLSSQRESSFELRDSELKIFQSSGSDSRNTCSGTSPMVSQFVRIF